MGILNKEWNNYFKDILFIIYLYKNSLFPYYFTISVKEFYKSMLPVIASFIAYYGENNLYNLALQYTLINIFLYTIVDQYRRIQESISITLLRKTLMKDIYKKAIEANFDKDGLRGKYDQSMQLTQGLLHQVGSIIRLLISILVLIFTFSNIGVISFTIAVEVYILGVYINMLQASLLNKCAKEKQSLTVTGNKVITSGNTDLVDNYFDHINENQWNITKSDVIAGIQFTIIVIIGAAITIKLNSSITYSFIVLVSASYKAMLESVDSLSEVQNNMLNVKSLLEDLAKDNIKFFIKNENISID